MPLSALVVSTLAAIQANISWIFVPLSYFSRTGNHETRKLDHGPSNVSQSVNFRDFLDYDFCTGWASFLLSLPKHRDCSNCSTSTIFEPELDMTIRYQFLKGAKLGSLCIGHFW